MEPVGDGIEFSQRSPTQQSDRRPELQILTMDNLKRAALRARLEFAAWRHGETGAACCERELQIMAEHLGCHIKRKPFAIKYALES